MDILSALKSEASKLQTQLDTVNQAIEALGGKNNIGRGRKRGFKMSAEARANISRAQRRRWRKQKGKA